MVKVNGEEKDIAGRTLAEYFETTKYDMKRVATEINGEIVPKAQYAQTVLKDGDSSVTAVARLNVNFNIIYKHTLILCLSGIVAALPDDYLNGSPLEAKGITQAVFNITSV